LPRIHLVFACPVSALLIAGCNPHATLRKAIAPPRVS